MTRTNQANQYLNQNLFGNVGQMRLPSLFKSGQVAFDIGYMTSDNTHLNYLLKSKKLFTLSPCQDNFFVKKERISCITIIYGILTKLAMKLVHNEPKPLFCKTVPYEYQLFGTSSQVDVQETLNVHETRSMIVPLTFYSGFSQVSSRLDSSHSVFFYSMK